MKGLSATLQALAFQLLIGTVLFSAGAAWPGRLSRRKRAAWSRASRELRRVAPVALLALGGSILVSSLGVGRPVLDLEPVRLVWPGAFSIAGALSTSGCYLIWRAGRLESGGGRRAARRRSRLAAGAILFGVAGLAALLLGSTIPHVPSSLTAAALLGATGWVAVLAGLSGKPRPGGQVAVVLYLFGLFLLVRASC